MVLWFMKMIVSNYKNPIFLPIEWLEGRGASETRTSGPRRCGCLQVRSDRRGQLRDRAAAGEHDCCV